MPFMDTVLAGVVARFPDKFLVGGRGGKTVLRAAMSKMLPAEILQRKKVGFIVPLASGLEVLYRDLVQDLLTSQEWAKVARICNQAKLHHLVSEHISGRQNHKRILWSLASLELFIRTFKPTQLDQIEVKAA